MPPAFTLRPFTRDDFETLKRWATSPEFLLQWTGRTFTWPMDDAQLEAYLSGAEADPPDRYLYMVVDPEDGTPLGHIGLREVNRTDESALVTCVLVAEPAGRGRGLGTAMMERLCGIAFEELGLHRLELYVFDFNEAAIACYKRVGFRIEGLIRDRRKLGDHYWSPYLMSLLRPEWEAKRRNESSARQGHGRSEGG